MDGISGVPRFRVKALGAFKQLPGCPQYDTSSLLPERLERLCKGECYNPSDERFRITRIEVIRIRLQMTPTEPIGTLIEDPWKSYDCPAVY